jgi:alcohol dehydrogenase
VGFECSASPAGFSELLSRLRPHARACVLSDGNWGQLALPAAFHERELSVVASSDGDDYHAYAGWLWANADPLLERLFEVTVLPAKLIGLFERLQRWPRPVSVVVDWTRGTAFE